MQGGTAFEQFLDEQLQELEVSRPAAAPGIPRSTAASYGFFFLDSASRSIVVTASPAVTVRAAAHLPGIRRAALDSWTVPPSAPRPVTPTRCAGRSRRQQMAIDELLALGAQVAEECSLDELRSTFRALARRYHPDRHADASAAQKVHLSAQFARLCDAYRELNGSRH